MRLSSLFRRRTQPQDSSPVARGAQPEQEASPSQVRPPKQHGAPKRPAAKSGARGGSRQTKQTSFWDTWDAWLLTPEAQAMTGPQIAAHLTQETGRQVTAKAVYQRRYRLKKAGGKPAGQASSPPAACTPVPSLHFGPTGRLDWSALADWLRENKDVSLASLAAALTAAAGREIPYTTVVSARFRLAQGSKKQKPSKPPDRQPFPPAPTLCDPLHGRETSATPPKQALSSTSPRQLPPEARGEWRPADDATARAELGRIVDEKCGVTGKRREYVVGKLVGLLVEELR